MAFQRRSMIQSPQQRVDLNPMLDVVFIMLIFFVVTAVFVREEGLDVSPPEPSTQRPPDPKKSILVKINGNNQILVQNQPVDVRRVSAHLARLVAQQPQSTVAIHTAPSARTQVLVAVMDSARQVGARGVSLVE